MAKRLNPRKLRAVLTYTVPELADALGVTSATVRAMIRRGMTAIDGSRPILILGEAAKEFIEAENQKAKQPLASDEFYCFGCHRPTRPDGNMVDLHLSNSSQPRIIGLCERCSRVCSKTVSLSTLSELEKIFDLSTDRAKRA